MLRDCSYVLLVLFRLYGQRNRSYYTREIEDTILLALQKPEVYDDIARATCCKFGIDRPQVVPVQGLPQVKVGWENVECFFRYYFLEKMKWNSNFSGRTSVEPVDDQVFQLVF
eukprot:XP_023156761.1 uncharacterized protein LOC100500949 isoform X3 [Zea mays]